MAEDAYRQWLVEAYQKSSDAYDKAVMTLAGGALGISLAFVHQVAPHPTHKAWLAWTWGLLAVSLLLIFLSFLASQQTLLREIKKRDKRRVWPSWDMPGWATTILNVASGAALITGVVCLVRFAWFNI
jgi:hypothetical protein